jgi:rRNA-processing protein FCF1
MVRVILDTNFLFVPFQLKIDIFKELDRLFGKAEPVVPATVFEELETLAKGRSKTAKQASAALELARKCVAADAERLPDESYDDAILRIAKNENCPVATNDANLRKRLREDGVAVVYVRKKSHLVVEGKTAL